MSCREVWDYFIRAALKEDPLPSPEETGQVQIHIETCILCQERLDGVVNEIVLGDKGDCDHYLDQLQAYVEAQLEKSNLSDFADLQRHLDMCVECSEAYAILYETMWAEQENQLPLPVTSPVLNTDFLPKPIVEEKPPSFWASLFQRPLWIVAPTAAALLLVFVYLSFSQTSERTAREINRIDAYQMELRPTARVALASTLTVETVNESNVQPSSTPQTSQDETMNSIVLETMDDSGESSDMADEALPAPAVAVPASELASQAIESKKILEANSSTAMEGEMSPSNEPNVTLMQGPSPTPTLLPIMSPSVLSESSTQQDMFLPSVVSNDMGNVSLPTPSTLSTLPPPTNTPTPLGTHVISPLPTPSSTVLSPLPTPTATFVSPLATPSPTTRP